MHDRSPPAADRKRLDQRQRRRLAQQAYRRRVDDGKWIEPVEIDADIVEMLTATGWLKQIERDEHKKIQTAISAMLAEAAKR